VSFSERYLDHFSHPRGVGEIANPTCSCEVQHEGGGCFDRVKLTARLDGDRVAEVKFRARACSGTIAACSAMVEVVTGMEVSRAKVLTSEDLTEFLGGIPEKKQHSVELAARAIVECLAS